MKEDFQLPEFKLSGLGEVKAENGTDTYGRFVLEPLERGFGITLGNALRRVLLSSISGSAVIGVSIKGARHEYASINGVIEDPTMIILNLKGLIVKIKNQEDEDTSLSIGGETSAQTYALKIDVVNNSDSFDPHEIVVKAKDIFGNAIDNHSVEIINKDLEIAHVAPGGHLQMEIVVATGRGYASAEENKAKYDFLSAKSEGDTFPIPTDSSFSPIVKVNYAITPARVGRETDFDKLTMDVYTNGAIEPMKAVSQAADILRQYFELFVRMDKHTAESSMSIFADNNDLKKSDTDEKTIESLELSVRSYNCLKRAGISTIGELTGKTEEDMMKIKNLGKKSLKEVKEKLISLGLSFKKEN